MPFFTEENCSLHPVCTHCPVGLSSVATPFPLHSPQLDALGLRQGTAFACLFDFLYRPSEEVLSVMRPQLPPLLDPGAVKVGEGRGGGGAGRSKGRGGPLLDLSGATDIPSPACFCAPDCVICLDSGRDPDPSGGLAARIRQAVLVPPAALSTPIHVGVDTDPDPFMCGGIVPV